MHEYVLIEFPSSARVLLDEPCLVVTDVARPPESL